MTDRCYCMQVPYVLQHSIHHNCCLYAWPSTSAKEHLNTASRLGLISSLSVTPSDNSAITTEVKTTGGKSAKRMQT